MFSGPRLLLLLADLLLLGHREDSLRTRATRRLDQLPPIETAFLPTTRIRTARIPIRITVAPQVQTVAMGLLEIWIGTVPLPGSHPIKLLLGRTDEP